MTAKLVETVGEEELTPARALFKTDEDEKPAPYLQNKVIESMAGMHVAVDAIVIGLVYISTFVPDGGGRGGGKCQAVVDIKRNVVLPEILAAMEYVDTNAKLVAQGIPALRGVISGDWPQLVLEADVLEDWIHRVNDTLTTMKRFTISTIVERVQSLTKIVLNRPCVEAYINDEKYIKAMVARNVLKWSQRKSYSFDVVGLNAMIKCCERSYSLFRLSPPLKDDKRLQEELGAGRVAFDSGRKFLKIVAACATIQEVHKDQAPKDAAELIEGGVENLPKALRDALKALSDQYTPVSAKKTA